MKQSINNYEFHRAFEQMRPDNFSYAGLDALFEYLESYEDDTGEGIELDVISLCCDYSEYTLEEIKSEYDHIDEVGDAEDMDEVIEALNEHTMVIGVDNDTLIIQAF